MTGSRTLVLEGGGMRGTYTAGVLEAFAEAQSGAGLSFDDVVACSAGACSAASYLAGQPRRNREVYLDYLDGTKLVHYRRLLTGGNVMDIDYLTDRVTLELCPLDLTALRASPTRLHIAMTDALTGEVRYVEKSEPDLDLLTVFRATCALPFFYRRKVMFQGRRYLDGGVADPVPVRKAMDLSAKRLIVVLTSSIESRARRGFRLPGLNRLFAPTPAVRRLLEERHLRYREASELLREPPPDVSLSVIRPSRPLPVRRTTTNRERLREACDLGYEDGRAFLRRNEGSSPSASDAALTIAG